MNRSKLKTYAPQARREFIQAVTDRAAFYGLTKDSTEPITVQGDVAIIAGRAFPAAVAQKRERLEERVRRRSFEQVMEALAYTWFNRLVAIRFMELHGYLDHGYRVLSHPEGKITPEIVEHAEHVDLPGLDRQKVIELKLDGTREAELYRMLLIAQCNALNSAMPFLFERINDETELLLPDNLLHSDSIIRKLVSEIDEEDWQQVEIIGWLYQFYISEKKDQVIGKVVKSEDIPAATQLFTPNWIVKYLIQNSLGRKWLATYPDSSLKKKWEYYIEPAEQAPEVQAKLKEITPTSLNPEELTIMDPACGSGHILVEAYDLLKKIYLERGYRLKDIPKLILTKNVYGLEIDDRAAQLAAFALMMKAREDDRRIFDQPPPLNVMAIQESNGLPTNTIVQAFTEKRMTEDDDLPAGEFGFFAAERAPLFVQAVVASPAAANEKIAADLKVLLALFEDAKTYGSLITIPSELANRLPVLAQALQAAMTDANMVVQHAARIASGFVRAAMLLVKRFDAVLANPPYMGYKSMPAALKDFAREHFTDAKADLYSMFIDRGIGMSADGGLLAYVTMHGWMFQATHGTFRTRILQQYQLECLAHLGPRAFEAISGEVVQAVAFTLRNLAENTNRPVFTRVVDSNDKPTALRSGSHRFSRLSQVDFLRLHGCPLAYALTDDEYRFFTLHERLSDVGDAKKGSDTGDNERFLRMWYEVDRRRICLPQDYQLGEIGKRWFPYSKGGPFRRWYGNNEYVVDWADEGKVIRKAPNSTIRNERYFFREALAWSDVATCPFSARAIPAGFLFDAAGPAFFPKNSNNVFVLLGYLNSSVLQVYLDVVMQGFHYSAGVVGESPFVRLADPGGVQQRVRDLVETFQRDWDERETSWDFQRLCVAARHPSEHHALSRCVQEYLVVRASVHDQVRALEHHIDAEFASAAKLTSPSENGACYGSTFPVQSISDVVTSVLSCAIGCMMGRYSLDKPGLIYANSGGEGFDPSEYRSLPADPDGIIPVTELDWFPDSAARRFEEFVGVAWPREYLEENLEFVAASLGAKNGGQSRDTIRRYFASDFYKHHLQTYKRRPIYWLFSSGKQRAFQALVYLHRYHEGTLARMRTEYVVPLQGKITARIEQLAGDATQATSSAHRKKLEKDREILIKQQQELRVFDEKLRHYADQQIKLDLDDGVKVNYGKFGDLLAEVKTVCGSREED